MDNNNIIDFSIIIPCHNLELYIKQLLLSFHMLNLINLKVEFIFILDACEDKTKDIIIKYMDSLNQKYYIYECNYHSSGFARNEGFSYAKGKYIWFIDGDDWIVNPQVLQDCFLLFQNHPSSSFIKIKYICNDAIRSVNHYSMVWQYIFTKQSIQNIKFVLEQPAEDNKFMDEYWASGAIGLNYDIPSYFYNYNRPGSNMYIVYNS